MRYELIRSLKNIDNTLTLISIFLMLIAVNTCGTRDVKITNLQDQPCKATHQEVK